MTSIIGKNNGMSVLYDSGDLEDSLSERRRIERKRFRAFAHLVLRNGNCIAVRTLDISLNGIAIIAPVNMPPKSRCQIVFRISAALQSAVKVCVSGRSAHSILSSKENGFVIGFEFIGLQKCDKHVIEKYVAA